VLVSAMEEVLSGVIETCVVATAVLSVLSPQEIRHNDRQNKTKNRNKSFLFIFFKNLKRTVQRICTVAFL